MQTPIVSVIIPTFNSERTIGRCLRSVKNQSYSNIEIIVVDRYSSDATLEIARKFSAKVWLFDSERSAAKNFGVAKAKGIFVMFVDSDMELTRRVIEECVSQCLARDLDAIDVSEISIAQSFWAECRQIEKTLYVEDPNAFLMPRFFRKEVFDSVGGLDENLVFGEDFDLGRRVEEAGYSVGKCKSVIKHHEGKLTLKRIVLKAYQYGKTLPSFVKKNPSLYMKAYCPTRFFKNYRVLVQHPTHFSGVLFLKFLEYGAYLAGVLSSFA